MATVSKTRLIFGIFLMVLIVIIDLALHHLHLATWPAFMVMIFFFESHMNPNRAPHILIGGLFGILNLVLIGIFLKVAAPVLGILPAKLVYVCLFVYLIVALGETVPVLFNNYAFMFFLVAALAAKVQDPAPNPWMWMGIELVGGLGVIGGIMGITRLMAVCFTPKAHGSSAGQETEPVPIHK
ncbi:uncharacterized protein Dvar_34580 [Desulfosarcina variabilis str. Montpellier]|uniref:hypothetical protein n=1 Tax=Desulfosarcina variabilis TaxID=2300 RepID=UPI003AFB4833